MRALLSIESGLGEPRVCNLDPEHSVTLGRHRQNLIVLHDEHASRWHAEIFYEDGHWHIRDFGALNGTRVDGETIVRQAPLQDGQVISIGKTSLRFSLLAEGANGVGTKPQIDSAPLTGGAPSLVESDETILCKDELTVLCQFMANSVRESDPRTVIQRALEVVHGLTGASVSWFLSLDPDDPLPKIVLPKLARVDIHLSRQLTQEVERQGRAVWLGAQPDLTPENSLLSF